MAHRSKKSFIRLLSIPRVTSAWSVYASTVPGGRPHDPKHSLDEHPIVPALTSRACDRRRMMRSDIRYH